MGKKLLIVLLVIALWGGYKIIFREEVIKSMDVLVFGEYKERLKEVIERYEKQNPRIKINIIDADYFDFVSNITENFKNGEKIPDCFIVINDHLSPLVDNGIIEETEAKDLDYCVEKEKGAFLYNGKYYGYPFKGEMLYLFYNNRFVKNPGNSIKEILNESQNIEKLYNVKGIDFPVNEFYYHFPWYTYSGGNIQDLLEMEKHTDTLKKELKTTSDLFRFSDYNSVTGGFKDEKTAMILNGSWAFEHIDSSGIDYDYQVIRDDKFRPFLGVKGFVVSKRSKVKHEVREFIKYMTGENVQKEMVSIPGFLPANKLVFETSDKKYVTEARAVIEKTEIMPNKKGIKVFWEGSYKLLSRVFEGNENIDKVVDDIFLGEQK